MCLHTHLLCHIATASVRWWMPTSTRWSVKVAARLRYAEMSIRFLNVGQVRSENNSALNNKWDDVFILHTQQSTLH